MANHRRALLVVVLLLTTSMLACEVSIDLGGETPQPTSQPPVSVPTVPSWPLALTDAFDDPESGFSRDSDETRRHFYRDGYYGIEILKEDSSNWTWRGDIFSDFLLEVDITSQREAGRGGLIFRLIADQQFYHFTITPDGRYRLQKKLMEDNWETLLDWTESPHIRTGLATNRLGVVCVGSTISLYVNGQFLDTVWDTTYTEGKIGLTAETFEGETHTLFHFDNLRVYAPTAALPPTPTATLLPPTPTVVPPTPTVPPQPGLLLEDDFSDPGTGWEVGDDEDGSVGYKDGVYFVIAREKNQTVVGRANRSFDNIVIEVDATQVSAGPTDNNDYGVTCRGQASGDKYYLLISGDGYYTILKWAGGEFEKLVDWTTSDVIHLGNASNHIRAVCDGSRLALYVNGELLAEANDAAFSAGDIGLTATTYEDESTEVHFDNLRVYAPAPMVQETVTPLPPATATPIRAGRIAFTSLRDGNNEIYVMNADGSGVTRLTNNPAIEYAPAGSPDGRRIAFMSRRDDNFEIYVMNADGSGQNRLTNSTADDWDPAWSPDGTRIAFASYVGGNNEIYVMNADGSGVTRLTNNSANDLEPCWSPDGTRIVFVSSRAGNNEIYVMNADGSGVARLTNNSANDGQPSWSPSGRIVFASTRDDNDEIYSMNAGGSGVTRLTDNSASDFEPCWSPDGTRIAFTSYRDGNQEIYVMNADGSGETRLTNNSVDDWDSSWFPG